MTNNISRRRIAKGGAWALPAVALASAAPAQAASVPPAGCYLTDAQLNAGVCSAQSVSPVGALMFSNSGGGAANATTANDVSLVSTCNYKGSVTAYWTSSFGLGSQVPAATIQFTDGTVFSGRTGGTISSGGAIAGFLAANSVTWTGTVGTRKTPARWTGAVVTVPFVWYYTGPDIRNDKGEVIQAGVTNSCKLALQYTMGGPYSGIGQNMINPTIIAI